MFSLPGSSSSYPVGQQPAYATSPPAMHPPPGSRPWHAAPGARRKRKTSANSASPSSHHSPSPSTSRRPSQRGSISESDLLKSLTALQELTTGPSPIPPSPLPSPTPQEGSSLNFETSAEDATAAQMPGMSHSTRCTHDRPGSFSLSHLNKSAQDDAVVSPFAAQSPALPISGPGRPSSPDSVTSAQIPVDESLADVHFVHGSGIAASVSVDHSGSYRTVREEGSQSTAVWRADTADTFVTAGGLTTVASSVPAPRRRRSVRGTLAGAAGRVSDCGQGTGTEGDALDLDHEILIPALGRGAGATGQLKPAQSTGSEQMLAATESGASNMSRPVHDVSVSRDMLTGGFWGVPPSLSQQSELHDSEC